MSPAEAAERLEISRSLVYALIEEGRLKCLRIGRRGRRGKIVIKDEHVSAFIEEVKAELEDD